MCECVQSHIHYLAVAKIWHCSFLISINQEKPEESVIVTNIEQPISEPAHFSDCSYRNYFQYFVVLFIYMFLVILLLSI